MDKEELRSLLNQPYKTENWKKITDSVFPNVSYLQKPKNIPYTSDKVKSFKQIGNVKLQDGKNLAMFEVLLDENVQIARNKVELRKLVTPFIDQEHNHGVLVIYEQGKEDYRFTFTAKSTEFDEEESDFINVETDSKRYTYVLGQNETCKTAANRFWELSKNKDKATIKDVQDAFSVEKLSKQFFTEYKAQYENMVAYLTSGTKAYYASVFNGDEKKIRDFVKLFLGRIIFIKFIQKKGWLGVPANSDNWESGQVNFIENAYRNYKTPDIFLSSFLNPLFFDVLNKPDRPNDIFSLTKTRVPYLNGGLFENEDTKLLSIDFPSSYFDSLFDFLDQYNFTIDESDPVEREVSIDPEMLGHIFENLLEDNKDKGAFYTPKAIVHYMCQESLIEYLNTFLQEKNVLPENEERKKYIGEAIRKFVVKKQCGELVNDFDEHLAIALHDVKICDPAIGSGAFPMGLLNEIFHCVQVLHDVSPDVVGAVWEMENWQPNIVKQNIIQNSVYGVDIEKGAVDIARLRFWLSLIVDEPVPTALPNLDYKIVVGNSLVSTFEDEIIEIDWSLNDTSYGLFAAQLAQEKNELLISISKKQKEFFKPRSNKKKLSADIRNLKIDLISNQIKLMIEILDFSTEPKRADYRNKPKSKFTEDYNKYLQSIGWKEKIKKLKKLREDTTTPLHFFDWKLDFPEIMNERVNIKVGFDIVIGNPPYNLEENPSLKEIYKKKYKTLQFKINLFACFIELGFNLLKKDGFFSFIIPNLLFANDSLKLTRKFFIENSDPIFFMNLGDNIFENVTVPTMIFATKLSTSNNHMLKIFPKVNNIKNLESDYFTIIKEGILKNFNYVIETSNPLVSILLRKLESNSEILDLHLDINQGIITGNDKVFLSDKKKSQIWKQTIRGKDIQKYFSTLPTLFVKYSKEELACPRSIDLFDVEEKLLLRRTGDSPIATFDSNKTFNLHTLYSCRSKNNIPIKFYLALLNSSLFRFIYQQKLGTEIGRVFAEIKILYIRQLPIIKNIKTPNIFTPIVDKILAYKAQGKDCTSLEKKIDYMVYRLYELTYEEVKVIEPDFRLNAKEYEAISIL